MRYGYLAFMHDRPPPNNDVKTVSVVITEVLGFWSASPAFLLWDIKRGSR
jgi:hypothetical protein